MKILFNAILFFLYLFLLCSCREKESNPNEQLQLDSFDALKRPSYVINSRQIRRNLHALMREERDSLLSNHQVYSYYANKGSFLWITRHGVDERADSLLSHITKVNEIGFSAKSFFVHQIKADLRRLRSLNFDERSNSINLVMARLEFHLTKAYLCYAAGQRYGFTNPYQLFNRLDPLRRDSVFIGYSRLFDIPIEQPSATFWKDALRKIGTDSVSAFLQEVQPQNGLYRLFKKRLAKAETKQEKVKVLCNLERARWRLLDEPSMHKKYVLVNVPSFHLLAMDHKKSLSMRIGCGTFDTKTPLLTSRIMRMDINPQWIIPRSIIAKTVASHAGDAEYFARHRYYVREKKSAKRMDVATITYEMLMSGDYRVIQEGGEGNSLGRIIFRFPNNFSVFLHDTSSRNVFSKQNRDVSHGCVRIEKPFDFSVFLLEDKDDRIIEKIKYSMTADIGQSSIGGKNGQETQPKERIDRRKMIGSVAVKPEIPLFITYYTLYPDEHEVIKEYNDVYGFDRIIYLHLRNYLN